ncbi:MAG: cysteine-rich CWC family protein [Blastocatellia bacterium]
MIDQPLPEKIERVCESCGAEFGCGVMLEGCWCAEIKLSEKQAADIRKKYNNCLCPKCLLNKAETRPVGSAP